MNTLIPLVGISLLVWFVSFPAAGNAQQRSLSFHHLTIDDGLSQNSVNCIHQDRSGFLWFGTQDGLNRYDGYTFKTYHHESGNPNSLGNSYVWAIHEDTAGILWIGSFGGGLTRFDPSTETFSHFRHEKGVNADAILKGIKATGKFVIYGIYFDFDKADVKPESEPTLKEIVSVLKNDPSLNLYVVGHTDMKGALNYNVDLSKRRAAAVVKELTTTFSIASAKLTSDGVGPLAPVATNETEDGRKKNRRVELVAK